jgi:hypothetical protein
MYITILIITSLTLLVVLGFCYLEIRRQIKPRIKIYFPDGSTRASYKAREETNVTLHIKNSGRLAFPKPAATEMTLYVYAPTSFQLKKLEYGNKSETVVNDAPAGGIFRDMRYLSMTGTFDLFHQEEEVVTVLMQMPEKTGKYTIKVPVTSREGDLGIHELEIIVT